jgi:coniferyl-aldehyde dehydrogenase
MQNNILQTTRNISVTPKFTFTVEAFISAYHQAVSNLYPEGPASKDYSSIISDRHFTRLQSLLEDAEVKGAKVIQVGNPSNVQSHPRQFPPSVVVGSNHAMRILRITY